MIGGEVHTRTHDSSLLTACRSGDAAAWDQLVERYQRLVFSIAVREGLSREDAADVTQATFIALLDSIDDIRNDASVASWLATVARRQAWRIRHAVQREHATVELDDSEDPIADYERVVVLHEAIARLGSPCRDLLWALYFDASEPSYAQIAARLGRAIGSLGPLRARCLQRLRVELGEARP